MNLVERIIAHAESRPVVTVRLGDFAAGGDSDEVAFVMRALVVAEFAEATEAALEARKRALKSLPENHQRSLLEDPTILEDAKSTEIVWRACRDASDHSKPAFPSAEWMRQHLTREQFVILHRMYELAEQRASKVTSALTLNDRETLATTIALAAFGDSADRMLAGMPTSVLVDFTIWACRAWFSLSQEPKTDPAPAPSASDE